MMKLESFSRNAGDLIRLRAALYGPEQAQALMLRCFKRSRRGRKVNETTVLNCWSEMDEAIKKVLEGEDQ